MRKPSFADVPCSSLGRAGMLFGALVRSRVGAGTLRSVRAGAQHQDGRILLTAGDLPARKSVDVLGQEVPLLCAGEISYPGEPIALVLAESAEEARRAAESAEAGLDADDLALRAAAFRPPARSAALSALRASNGRRELPDGAISRAADEILGRAGGRGEGGRILAEARRRGGGLDENADGLAEFAGVWTDGIGRLCPREPLCAMAEEDGGILRVHAPSAWLSALSRAAADAAGVPEDSVEVVRTELPAETGGTNGITLGLAIGSLAAAAAKATGRPVMILLSPEETDEFVDNGAEIRVEARALVRADGGLAHLSVGIDVDAGAFCPFAEEAAERLSFAAAGLYAPESLRVRATVRSSRRAPASLDLGSIASHAFLAAECLMQKISAATGITPREIRRRNRADTALAEGARIAVAVDAVSNTLDPFIRLEDKSATKDDVFRAKKFTPGDFSASELERKFQAFRISALSRPLPAPVSPSVPRPRGVGLSAAASGSGLLRRGASVEAEIRGGGKVVVRSLPVPGPVWGEWQRLTARRLPSRETKDGGLYLDPEGASDIRWPDNLDGWSARTALLSRCLDRLASGERRAEERISAEGGTAFASAAVGACTAEVEIDPCTFGVALRSVRLAVEGGRTAEDEALRAVQSLLPALAEDGCGRGPEVRVEVFPTEAAADVRPLVRSLVPAAFAQAVSLALGTDVGRLPVSRADIFRALVGAGRRFDGWNSGSR